VSVPCPPASPDAAAAMQIHCPLARPPAIATGSDVDLALNPYAAHGLKNNRFGLRQLGALSRVGQLPALSFDLLLIVAGHTSGAYHRFSVQRC